MDKSVFKPVGLTPGTEESFTKLALLIADNGMQRMAGIVHKLFAQCPHLYLRTQQVRLHANHRGSLLDQVI